MIIKSTSYLYNKDGYDYKYVFGRNNNDDKVMVSYFRLVGTTAWFPLVEEVVLVEMDGGQQ